ncbi:hypothetical protein N0M98_17455 [Paenibacillus doosanensis]|uniref:hypothetical protein n=1 Tax=Paenibacillus doosanensis TaxID=1229154 RepID=UPI00217F74A4|nr:hypothetical protein [Paenibacillus doosanensis]MCS7461927.1 hypothetical protein [Paenibacillus doosanensis]
MKRRRYVWAIAIFLCLVWYLPEAAGGGYFFSESAAIRKTFSLPEAPVVYEKTMGDKKIVIANSEGGLRAMLLETKWKVLHRVTHMTALLPRDPSDTLLRTWSASLTSDNQYDTLIVAQSKHPDAKQIIVSNDALDQEIPASLEQVRKASSIFIEMDVENGFAVYNGLLEPQSVGAFVFRQVDDSRRVLSVGY